MVKRAKMESIFLIKVCVYEDWANPSDFEKEIDQFNEANANIVEANVLHIEPIEKDTI